MKAQISMVAVVVAAVALVSVSTGAVAGTLITSAKIKDKTIQVRDLAPGTVTALKAGVPRVYQASVTKSVFDGDSIGYAAACKKGDLAIGGGVKPDGPGVLQQGSYPLAAVAGNAWVNQIWNQSGSSRSVVFYVSASIVSAPFRRP